MTSIPVGTCWISRNKFKRHYLKKKTFFGFFLAFLKCALNLEYFEKKDEYPNLVISRIIDSEWSGYLNV